MSAKPLSVQLLEANNLKTKPVDEKRVVKFSDRGANFNSNNKGIARPIDIFIGAKFQGRKNIALSRLLNLISSSTASENGKPRSEHWLLLVMPLFLCRLLQEFQNVHRRQIQNESDRDQNENENEKLLNANSGSLQN